MVFLVQVENAENHWPRRGSEFPAGLAEGASIDRGRPAALPEAKRPWVDQHGKTVSQLFGSKLHGHVADDVSKSRAYHRRGLGMCQARRGKAEGRGRWNSDRGQPC